MSDASANKVHLYRSCKIYTDSSHYVAIVPSARGHLLSCEVDPVYVLLVTGEWLPANRYDGSLPYERFSSRKQEFDSLYDDSVGMDRAKRFPYIVERISPLFPNALEAAQYVQKKLKNKDLARQARATRFMRKALLNKFNYYVTFTYDDSKFSSYADFDRALRKWCNNNAYRNDWKIMFVPEFGDETGRYHVHALIYVPDPNTLSGAFVLQRKYNKKKHRMVDVNSNSYCSTRFGLNDWQSLSGMSVPEVKRAINYVIKYMTKTDNRAYISRGLPTFLLSDMRDCDFICSFGRNGAKMVLFDDFHLFYRGVDIGCIEDDFVKFLGVT